MSRKSEIKQFILRALEAADGVPLPDAALLQAVRAAMQPSPPPEGDINAAIREQSLNGWIHGTEDSMTKDQSWTLTPKGQHKAKQL